MTQGLSAEAEISPCIAFHPALSSAIKHFRIVGSPQSSFCNNPGLPQTPWAQTAQRNTWLLRNSRIWHSADTKHVHVQCHEVLLLMNYLPDTWLICFLYSYATWLIHFSYCPQFNKRLKHVRTDRAWGHIQAPEALADGLASSTLPLLLRVILQAGSNREGYCLNNLAIKKPEDALKNVFCI